MNRSMIWFGRYEGWLRHVAKGVKYRDPQCIAKAALLFDMMLPDHCIVVPMPSHSGMAHAMLDVANALPKGKRHIADGLICDPHESSFDAKKSGYAPRSFEMRLYTDQLETARREDFDGGIYIIDNVICTGVTASAALRAVESRAMRAQVFALAYSPWR